MAEQLVRHPEEVERRKLARSLGISYRRLHGWEPATVQRGYDRNGEQVELAAAWEILTTHLEPEWDDQERAQLIALARYERGVGPCGFHHSLTNDLSNTFTFDEDVCPVCRGLTQYERIQEDRDAQQLKRRFGTEKPPPTAALPADGRTTRPRLMHPLEAMKAREDRTAGRRQQAHSAQEVNDHGST